jgi:hypothetical protein
MKTVFARALVALVPLAVLALPASAFASSKTAHSHSVAKKEPKKKGKHHSHKTASAKPPAASSASKAP